MSNQARRTRRPAAAAALALVALVVAATDAATPRRHNLTQLVAESQSIIIGKVEHVTDGIDEHGLPYTEIAIAVSESAKGDVRGGTRHSFRQFGLLTARMTPGSELLPAISPAGFPQWSEGERVVAFLHRPATRTGFQTTAGLAQGKLQMRDGRVSNAANNAGLFDGVHVQEGLLSQKERALLSSSGPVDAATLVGLVRRAVSEHWIESGQMR